MTALCPGFVNTRIIESERNRPEHLAATTEAPDAEVEQLRAVMRELYGNTKAPAEVAVLVVEAIRHRRLYCFTDEQFLPLVAARQEALLGAAEVPNLGQLWEHLPH